MMKNALIFALVCFVAACATTTATPAAPATTLEQEFHDKLYVEIHNTENHCIVRIWNMEHSEEEPQAIFRGVAGSGTCRIYNIINPDITGDE